MGVVGEDPSGAAGWLRPLKVIEQFGKPLRIAQKQPSQHRLKPRGLPIKGRISAPRTASGPVTAAPHQIKLLGAEAGFEALKGIGLGGGLHPCDHGPVQIDGPGGLAAVEQALMQLPDGIPKPGELLRRKFDSGGESGQAGQPGGRGIRRRRGCQAPAQDRVGDSGIAQGAPASRSG